MRAMLLAAGRGTRLAALTKTTPKPLVRVGGEAVLIRHIRRFAAAGFKQIVINLHHLPQLIKRAAGDGSAFGVEILYSPEPRLLGTGGGIRLAIERGLLSQPFALANGDIICDYDVQKLRQAPQDGAHLILVPNPPAKTRGDFSLNHGRLIPAAQAAPAYTYAGIGVFHPALFAAIPAGQPYELLPILQQAINDGSAGGELYQGAWHDIGTPQSLAEARRCFGG